MNPALPKPKLGIKDVGKCNKRKSGVNPALPNKKWYYVYLLTSKKTHFIYKGCTNDLKKRL